MRSKGRVGRRDVVFLARWHVRKAVQHARDRIRHLTLRSRLLSPVDEVVADGNRSPADRSQGHHQARTVTVIGRF